MNKANFHPIALPLALTLLSLVGCSDEGSNKSQEPQVIEYKAENQFVSSTAGNLIATAIKEVHDLDVVLYPSGLIRKDQFAIFSKNLPETDREKLLELYPIGVADQFRVGSMKGKDIKELILNRSQENYEVELEVAGVEYDIRFTGGLALVQNFTRERDFPLEDDQYYRIAINNYYYFSGATFPGYKYRNSASFVFREDRRMISAREALTDYLHSTRAIPYLQKRRAVVRRHLRGNAGFKQIHEIQGASHISSLYAHQVTTQGVVTAIGLSEWYPGGMDLYIQSAKPDQRADTSEGLHVYVRDENFQFDISKNEVRRIEIGDFIQISGVIYEEMTGTGMSRTSLKEVNHIAFKGKRPLPEPVVLKLDANSAPSNDKAASPLRYIPHQRISTYRGNLNNKQGLKLSDGIDFWESLEGMRVQMQDLRVVGFRGGQEEFESLKPKSYLNLYIVPDGFRDTDGKTSNGGIIVNPEADDFNPEVLTIVSNHLSAPFDTNTIFKVGDVIAGEITGVLGYEKNLFGDGEYSLVLPEEQQALTDFSNKKKQQGIQQPSLYDRPKTRLKAGDRNLTIANFNVENLSGSQTRRVLELAKAISYNLKCPDILNLVEVQDYNGIDYDDDNGAERTLKKLIRSIDCPGTDYQPVNIDPYNHNEGGQPGGNIRVAMIYDSNRVQFQYRPIPGPLEETRMTHTGDLNHNPGRVKPNEKAFDHSRRSIIAQFEFKGRKLILIGNHFNSKLGDKSLWGPVQPVYLGSENKRSQLANIINKFVQTIENYAPDAHIAVLGDFNAMLTEDSMKILAGRHLHNLLSLNQLVPINDRYTTNYNGNSQPLDYIFVNRNFLDKNPEVEVIHINSDFMGRISDHDPVVSRFTF